MIRATGGATGELLALTVTRRFYDIGNERVDPDDGAVPARRDAGHSVRRGPAWRAAPAGSCLRRGALDIAGALLSCVGVLLVFAPVLVGGKTLSTASYTLGTNGVAPFPGQDPVGPGDPYRLDVERVGARLRAVGRGQRAASSATATSRSGTRTRPPGRRRPPTCRVRCSTR